MASLVALFSNRNVHKLLGTAIAGLGLSTGITTTAGWREITIGSLYAAIMHIVGGMKKTPDSAHPLISGPTP